MLRADSATDKVPIGTRARHRSLAVRSRVTPSQPHTPARLDDDLPIKRESPIITHTFGPLWYERQHRTPPLVKQKQVHTEDDQDIGQWTCCKTLEQAEDEARQILFGAEAYESIKDFVDSVYDPELNNNRIRYLQEKVSAYADRKNKRTTSLPPHKDAIISLTIKEIGVRNECLAGLMHPWDANKAVWDFFQLRKFLAYRNLWKLGLHEADKEQLEQVVTRIRRALRFPEEKEEDLDQP